MDGAAFSSASSSPAAAAFHPTFIDLFSPTDEDEDAPVGCKCPEIAEAATSASGDHISPL